MTRAFRLKIIRGLGLSAMSAYGYSFIQRAISVPKGIRYTNLLIFKCLFEERNFRGR